ncbi:MAG: molybdate ABC transporter substrate-binding protein [Burkholderiaceae bacterium]
MLRRRFLFLAALAWAGLAYAQPHAQPHAQSHVKERPPVVAAASDLKFALEAIAADFERETGRQLLLNFGSSGNFARQIRQGAPFELFLSADEQFVNDLARDGLTRDGGQLYAIGRLALYAPASSPLALDDQLAGVRTDLASVRKFAIANPEHAPYGRAAQQALEKLGLWQPLKPKLVLGENISQAAQFVATGSAEAGLIALSLALAPELSRQGRYVVLPESLHAPLRQRMVLTKKAGATAEAFYRYLQTPKSRAVLERYGFTLPER